MDTWDADAFDGWRHALTTVMVEALVTERCDTDAAVAMAMQSMHDATYRAATGGYGDGFLLTGGKAAREVLWAFMASWAGMTDSGPGPVVWLRPSPPMRGGGLPDAAYRWLGRWPSGRGYRRDKWSVLMHWLAEVGTRVFVIEGIDRFADLEDMPVWLKAATKEGVVVIATRESAGPGFADLRMWMADLDLSGRAPLSTA